MTFVVRDPATTDEDGHVGFTGAFATEEAAEIFMRGLADGASVWVACDPFPDSASLAKFKASLKAERLARAVRREPVTREELSRDVALSLIAQRRATRKRPARQEARPVGPELVRDAPGLLRALKSGRDVRLVTKDAVNAYVAGLARSSFDSLAAFDIAGRVERIRSELLELLQGLRREGARVAGYGAAAKGNTLLNYCGIGPDQLDYIADKNQLKVGLYTPGMHIPVLPAAQLVEDRPDYTLILAWNMADEIMAEQEEYRRDGGRFIVPIPEPNVVES